MMANGRNGIVAAVGLSFLTGCFIGGIAGVLYAPQSGARTRRKLANFADDVQERAGEMTEDATGAIQNVVERGRRAANV
jgi:gas vesicle protein